MSEWINVKHGTVLPCGVDVDILYEGGDIRHCTQFYPWHTGKGIVAYRRFDGVKPESSALDKQEGGDHYKSRAIQPIEYCHANKLGPCESAIIKYATRWKDKGGKGDLLKIKHYVDLLIELEKL